MCGPSASEQMISGQQQSLASTLQANYNNYFGKQSQTMQNLNSIFTPIAQAGPDQQGFGANELAALNTNAQEGVGNQYAKAQRVLNNNLSARGGGNEFLPNGARTELDASLASAAANESARQSQAITTANYAQGRSNWLTATAGLNALAQEYNPEGIASGAESGYNSAFGMADKINQEKNQKAAAIAGGIAGLALGPLAGGLGALGPGESFSEGLSDFGKGALGLPGSPGSSGSSGSSGWATAI